MLDRWKESRSTKAPALAFVVVCWLAACSDDGAGYGNDGAGGSVITGGATAAGGAVMGAETGGTSLGGTTASSGGIGAGGGGAATGGASAGGTSAGGADAAGGTDPTADGGNPGSGGTANLEWLPSWATTIQTVEPRNAPPPLSNNTLRQFVWPTISGAEIRLQLSNEKGASPVEIQKVHIAAARVGSDPGDSNGEIDVATDTAFTFGGQESVTIPTGEVVWSDAVEFSLEKVTLTAISMQFGSSVPSAVTGHPGARTTSYVQGGDVVSSESIAGDTRDRWYFINAIEVMAPANAYAIAILGDSITDGYGILNEFARWPDFLTLEIDEDPMIRDLRSVLNFGMGANSLTSSDAYQDAGVIRFERDVLKRDKIKWLIVMEGVNDMAYGAVGVSTITNAYQQIIDKAHDAGIQVYGATITPCSACAARLGVNEWIRSGGAFDAVIETASAVSNGETWNRMYQNDDLHPNQAGYRAMAETVDLSLFYEVQ